MEKVREVGKSNHCVGPFVPDPRICVGKQGKTVQEGCSLWEGAQLLECELASRIKSPGMVWDLEFGNVSV